MTEPTPVEPLGYPAAIAELEVILARLEQDEPDVDRVAVDVARATELIMACRGRIATARLRVDEVVAALDAEVPTNDASPA